MKNTMKTLVILVSILLNAKVNSAQRQSIQNVGPHYVNGFPDQLALEQTQQQFVVNQNGQQNYLVDGNLLHSNQQLQTAGISGQPISTLVYPQNAHQIYQQQPQNPQQQQMVQIQTPEGSQFANFQYPQHILQNSYQPQPQNSQQQVIQIQAQPQNQQQQIVQIQAPEGNQFANLQFPQQILQNSHQVPVYQQQALQYLPVSPQPQQFEAQGHLSPFAPQFPHYGPLHFHAATPSFVGHPGALASPPVFHVKPTVLQHVPVPVAVTPVVKVKEIVKVPIPVRFQPICTVYPFQKNIPGCVLEKALFPGKYHPDIVVPSSSKKIEAAKTELTEGTTGTTPKATAKPESKTGPAKKNPSKNKNSAKEGFVGLNNADKEDIKDTTTEGSPTLNFDDDDEKLFLELEKEMQEGKEQ